MKWLWIIVKQISLMQLSSKIDWSKWKNIVNVTLNLILGRVRMCRCNNLCDMTALCILPFYLNGLLCINISVDVVVSCLVVWEALTGLELWLGGDISDIPYAILYTRGGHSQLRLTSMNMSNSIASEIHAQMQDRYW